MRDENELLRTPQDAKIKCTDVVVPCFGVRVFLKDDIVSVIIIQS